MLTPCNFSQQLCLRPQTSTITWKQVAAVCQTFRHAIKGALSEPSTLDLEAAGGQERMDSKLLLEWARASQWSVDMDEHGCGLPGTCLAGCKACWAFKPSHCKYTWPLIVIVGSVAP